MSGLHDIDIEQALLGAILIDNRTLEKLSGITADDFFEPLHGQLFGIMVRLHGENTPARPGTIAPFFTNAPPIGDLTVTQYLGRLAAAAVTTINATAYAGQIRDYAARRSLLAASMRMQQLANDCTGSVHEAAAEIIGDLDGIIAASGRNRITKRSLSESAIELIEGLDSPHVAVPSGLADLDKALAMRPGDYIIAAGRPSMGKSTLGSEIMLNAARSGYGVLMFSLEMSKTALAARCISSALWNQHTGIEYAQILNGKVPDYQRERLREAANRFASLPVQIDDQSGISVSEIAARARQQASMFERDGKKLGLVVIDHLGKIRASRRYSGQLVNEVGEVSAGIACLAKDLGVPVIALHQLNRAVEGRDDKHPMLADLRDSGNIEQDADAVLFMYRPAYYLERTTFEDHEREADRLALLNSISKKLEIVISKNRNGPCRVIECFIDIAHSAIRNRWR